MNNELDSAYLDYYNLIMRMITDKDVVAVENEKKQFLDRYGIKPFVLNARRIPVEDLFMTEGCDFRKHFEALSKYQSRIIDLSNKQAQQMQDRRAQQLIWSCYDNPKEPSPLLVWLDIKEHLNRTTPALVEVQPETGYVWRGFWCQDFLALVYLQLWMSVNGKERYAVCLHCKKTFATTKSAKKYCSVNCKKHAADARYRKRQKDNPEKKAAYNERMRRYMKGR